MDFRQSNLAGTTPYPLNIVITKARGSYLYTAENHKILDFISGIGVSCLGHGHPAIQEAVINQTKKHLHTMVYGEFVMESQFEYAREIIDVLPPFFEKVYFTNSGTEANEGALKAAKRFTGRSEIIAFKKAYHGSTHGSLSVSGNEIRKKPFRPLLPNVKFIEFDNIIDLNQITDKTAAVIIEPIQGDAGVIVPSEGFMKKLRDRCNSTSSLLIFDEVQTGFGRTGKLFAFEHFNVIPDIITLGKAIGGGLPLGAFISSAEVMNSLTFNPTLGHITTYGGSPLSCAAGRATLKTILEENLIEKSIKKSEILVKFLKKQNAIVDFRYKGLLFGIDLRDEKKTENLIKNSLEKGLLLFWFLSRRNSFRIAPPLTISEDEILEALEIIKSELTKN